MYPETGTPLPASLRSPPPTSHPHSPPHLRDCREPQSSVWHRPRPRAAGDHRDDKLERRRDHRASPCRFTRAVKLCISANSCQNFRDDFPDTKPSLPERQTRLLPRSPDPLQRCVHAEPSVCPNPRRSSMWPHRLDDGEAGRLDDGHQSDDTHTRSARNAHRRVGSPGFSSVMAI